MSLENAFGINRRPKKKKIVPNISINVKDLNGNSIFWSPDKIKHRGDTSNIKRFIEAIQPVYTPEI